MKWISNAYTAARNKERGGIMNDSNHNGSKDALNGFLLIIGVVLILSGFAMGAEKVFEKLPWLVAVPMSGLGLLAAAIGQQYDKVWIRIFGYYALVMALATLFASAILTSRG
jgi:hypothetical protein